MPAPQGLPTTAQTGGLEKASVVLKIDDQQVRDIEQFLAILEQAREEKKTQLRLLVRRGLKRDLIKVNFDWDQ